MMPDLELTIKQVAREAGQMNLRSFVYRRAQLLMVLLVMTLGGAALLSGCAKDEHHEGHYPTVHDLQVQARESRKQAERSRRITKELEARTARIHRETQLLKLRVGMTKSEVKLTCGPADDTQRFEDRGSVDVCGTFRQTMNRTQDIWYYGDFRTGRVQVVFHHKPQFKLFYTGETVPDFSRPEGFRRLTDCKVVPVEVTSINRY